MTRTLRLRDLESAAANASEQPFFTTGSEGRNGVRGTVNAPPQAQGLIFEEHFDDQPDYTSAMHSTDRLQLTGTHTVPAGWTAIRQDPKWAPSVGHPDRNEAIEILASNSSKARGGTGKSYVSWRDSYDPGWNRWNSDSILSKFFPEGYEQLYVQFYIAFSPEWSIGGSSKLFRMSSWSEGDKYFGYGGGEENGPVFIYQYSHSGQYGVRNALSFRGGPHGQNYGMNDEDMENFSRTLNASGDSSMSFMNNFSEVLEGQESPPFILNKVTNEGSITQLGRDPVHEELYGQGGEYTKLAFFVKMNSAPGVKDGEFKQWINDEMVVNAKVRWNKNNEENKHVKWNRVDIGGNDFFNDYPNEERHQEWYSIDDIVIRDSIPEGLI